MKKSSRRTFLRKLVLGSDRRTLVVIFLRGGADTLSMLVPVGDDQYFKIRPTLALSPRETSYRNLNDFYALSREMAPLYPLYSQGKLLFIQAVGSDNPSGSHFDAQDQIEHGSAFNQVVNGGWLARHIKKKTSTPLTSIAFEKMPESLRGANASVITKIEEIALSNTTDGESVRSALKALYATDLLLRDSGETTLALINKIETLKNKVPKKTAAEYPSGLGVGLKEIARLVKADVGVEIACIDMDGWDSHFFQAQGQPQRVSELVSALLAFEEDLRGHAVTTLVMSEFGRRSYENSSMGTDHGRGYAMFVMGDVAGGRVLGEYPSLLEEEPQGPGGMKVLHDYRQVLGEILTHHGETSLGQVFPDFKFTPLGLFESNPKRIV